jgi:hypothetical protein
MSYQGGLRKWFKEDWRDVKTGEKCGRKSAKGGSKRPYPACRPAAVAKRLSIKEKRATARRKTGSGRVNWQITASGRRRKRGN